MEYDKSQQIEMYSNKLIEFIAQNWLKAATQTRLVHFKHQHKTSWRLLMYVYKIKIINIIESMTGIYFLSRSISKLESKSNDHSFNISFSLAMTRLARGF